MGKAWDRRTNETDKAYEAFAAYLEMPERTIKKVSDLLSKDRQQLDRWARKYDWLGRAAAYDSSIVEEARRKKVRRLQRIIERKETIGELLLERAEEILRTLGANRGSFRSATEMADVGSRLLVEAFEMDNAQEHEPRGVTINIVSAGENGDYESG